MLYYTFIGYYDDAYIALKNYNDDCVSEMKKSMHDLKYLLNTPNGPTTISQLFKYCLYDFN